MNPTITILAEGVGESRLRAALESVEGLRPQRAGPDRGLADGAKRAFEWVCSLVGGSTKVADALLEQATSQLAGATMKVRLGDVEIEVTNANRSQLVSLLEKAGQISARRRDM